MVDQTWFAGNLHLYLISPWVAFIGDFLDYRRVFQWFLGGLTGIPYGKATQSLMGDAELPTTAWVWNTSNWSIHAFYHGDIVTVYCICACMFAWECVCVRAWVSVNSCDFSLRVGVFVCDVFSNMSLYTNKIPINVNATFAPHNSESPPNTRIPSVKWQKVRGCLQIKFQKHIVLSPHCWTRRRLATN